jgi:hypothetical protein
MKFDTFGRVTDATINSIQWSSSMRLVLDGAPHPTRAVGTLKFTSRILQGSRDLGGLVEGRMGGNPGCRAP